MKKASYWAPPPQPYSDVVDQAEVSQTCLSSSFTDLQSGARAAEEEEEDNERWRDKNKDVKTG